MRKTTHLEQRAPLDPQRLERGESGEPLHLVPGRQQRAVHIQEPHHPEGIVRRLDGRSAGLRLRLGSVIVDLVLEYSISRLVRRRRVLIRI